MNLKLTQDKALCLIIFNLNAVNLVSMFIAINKLSLKYLSLLIN